MASGTRPHPATAPPPLRWASASVSHGCSIPDRTEGRAGWEGHVSEATQSAFPPQGPDSHITTSGCRRGLGKALCILDGHVCKNQSFHYRVIKGAGYRGSICSVCHHAHPSETGTGVWGATERCSEPPAGPLLYSWWA